MKTLIALMLAACLTQTGCYSGNDAPEQPKEELYTIIALDGHGNGTTYEHAKVCEHAGSWIHFTSQSGRDVRIFGGYIMERE